MDGIVTEEQQETQDTQQLKKKQTSTLSAFTKKRKEIDELAKSSENLHLVKTAMNDLKQLQKRCEAAHFEYINALTAEERQLEQKKYEPNQLKIIGGMQKLYEWIAESEASLSDNLDNLSIASRATSRSRRSNTSTRSTSSSVISARAHERAMIAG
jgi:hypothetical protein